jgi:hypothetical protein
MPAFVGITASKFNSRLWNPYRVKKMTATLFFLEDRSLETLFISITIIGGPRCPIGWCTTNTVKKDQKQLSH